MLTLGDKHTEPTSYVPADHQRTNCIALCLCRTFREWQMGVAMFLLGNILNFVSFGEGPAQTPWFVACPPRAIITSYATACDAHQSLQEI
jgi:hypothetical protein